MPKHMGRLPQPRCLAPAVARGMRRHRRFGLFAAARDRRRHGRVIPTWAVAADHDVGVQFNNSLDAASSDRPGSSRRGAAGLPSLVQGRDARPSGGRMAARLGFSADSGTRLPRYCTASEPRFRRIRRTAMRARHDAQDAREGLAWSWAVLAALAGVGVGHRWRGRANELGDALRHDRPRSPRRYSLHRRRPEPRRRASAGDGGGRQRHHGRQPGCSTPTLSSPDEDREDMDAPR